jgi:DNA-binding NarL/FixJ family response regulator
VAGSEPVLRDGMRALLEERGFCVVGAAESGEEAVELARRSRPQVAVLDACVPGLKVLDIARQIRGASPETRVLLLAADGEDFCAVEQAADGVAGLVEKSRTPDEFVEAVGKVAIGTATWESRSCPNAPRRRELSPRQRDVLAMLAAAKSTREIAAHFGVSTKTVESHRSSVMEKLDIHDIATLVRFAIRRGLTAAGKENGAGAASGVRSDTPEVEAPWNGSGNVPGAARAALHAR